MLTNRTVYTKPAMPSFGAAGGIVVDPTFGSRILRVTDANTLPSSVNASHSTPSASHQLAWNKDSTKFYIRGTAATCVPFSFNPSTMQAARIAGSGDGGLVISTASTEPQFSWVDANIIYVTTTDTVPNNEQPIIQKYSFSGASYTTLLNLRTIPNVTLPAFRTYCGAIYGSETAPEKIATFFGGASQDQHYLVAVFQVGSPTTCTVIDTTNSLIYINGAAGVATSLTLGFLLHHSQIDRTGRYVTLEPTSADIAGGKAPKYIWDTQTNAIAALTPYPNAHTVMGWGDFINNDFAPDPGPYDGVQFSYRTLADPTHPRNIIRNPQSVGETYIDGHTTWNNALAASLQPVTTELYRAYDGPNDVSPHNTAPWRAWDDEIISIEVANSGATTTVFRHCHHHSIVRDDVDTAGAQPFWYQPRPNISPDGKWCLFTSNGDRTLGTELGSSSPVTKRNDVFLVEMQYGGSQPAKMYALAGVMRAGASRAGYTSPKLFVAVNGVQVATGHLTPANAVVHEGLQITEVLHETPNTAAFTTRGIEPTEGQDVVITLGSINNANRQFAGTILNRAHRYVEKPAIWFADLNAVDYTWQLTRRRVSGSYTNTAPATIAAAIVAAVPGFTLSVQAGLPTLDAFSYTDIDALAALTQLATRIGGYCDVDYQKVVKLFITDASVTNPTDLTAAHLTLREFSFTKDLSQVRTRVFVEGGGVNALAPCAVGETMIPVGTTAWYNANGGTVKSGSQHLAYAGVQLGGGGSLVGPGVTPSAGPTLTAVSGTSLPTGVYLGAYTFVTAAGESLPSPVTSFTLGDVPDAQAGDAPTCTNDLSTWGTQQVSLVVGNTVQAGLSFSYNYGGQHSAIVAGGSLTVTEWSGGSGQIAWQRFSASVTRPSLMVRYCSIWASVNGGTWFEVTRQAMTAAVGITVSISGSMVYSGNGAFPGVDKNIRSVTPDGIAVGPSGTTARKYYRSAVGASQLKLQQTIANNTATVGVTDSTADGSLGANAPTSDTSGLTQPSGQVNPGSTTLIVAGTAFASAVGGWVVVGSQVIRYTGFSGGSLTGIPSTGSGAIVAAVTYNTTVTAAPALTGIPASGGGSIRYAILQGDPVNLLVQVDDMAAQAALAALIGGGDDGIVEEYVQDGAIGETEARARGTAQLALFSTPLVSISYKTRDVNTHAGRTITVSLGSPTNLSGTFQIQQVTIDSFQYPRLYPTYTVQASSTRFSLEDLLRLARAA